MTITIEDFQEKFKGLFEDTDLELITPETEFKQLED